MGLLLFLAAGAVVGLSVLAMLASSLGGRFNAMRRWSLVAGGVSIAYVGVLAATNFSAESREIPRGQQLTFCGAYIDCHMSVSVEDVKRQPTLGTPPVQATAGGEFWVVTLKVSSSALRAELGLGEAHAYVVDEHGQDIEPSESGTNALRSTGLEIPPLSQRVGAGGSFLVPVVFDLPSSPAGYHLVVRDGGPFDHAIESLLFFDDDGLLRRPPRLQLDSTR